MGILSKKLIFFSLPIIVTILFPFALGVYTGDVAPLPLLMAMQRSNDSITSLNLYDVYDYKVGMTNSGLYDLLLCGDSRMLTFRSEFFRNSDVVYNAAVPGAELDVQQEFFEDITTMPNLVICDLFAVDFTELVSKTWGAGQIQHTYPQGFQSFMIKLLKSDNRRHVFLQMNLFTRRNPYGQNVLGVNAIAGGSGYRVDGSRQYTRYMFDTDAWEDLFSDEDEVTMGYGVNDSRIQQLESHLDMLNRQGVNAIFILPPYAPSAYDQILTAYNGEYILEAKDTLAQVFDNTGIPLFDFENPATLGIIDQQMLDQVHHSEYVSLLIIHTIATLHPELLDTYVDTHYTAELLARAEQSGQYFDVIGDAE